MFTCLALLAAAAMPLSEASLSTAFSGRQGALVIIEGESGAICRHNSPMCAMRFPPCSTFKIWNTAIGIESGLLSSADQPFYKWDGVQRSIEPWNHDLTIRQAYAVSCVPAYQALASRIGPVRMDEWLGKLGYGDRNTSSGNEVFWLPSPDRSAMLISPDEQARLLQHLAKGDVPFSEHTLEILKDIMTAKTTEHGTLFGKTGTGGAGKKSPGVGWFVGYLVSGKRTLAFACLLTGENATGKEARTLVEQLFSTQGLL